MTEQQIKLTEEWKQMLSNFIKNNNLSCNSCKHRKGSRCKKKLYCIVKYGHGLVLYEEEDNDKI